MTPTEKNTSNTGPTVTELDRTEWSARRTGGRSGFGPVLVTVRTTQTVRADGTICTPSYYVSIDGVHAFGGFAWHLGPDGRPPHVGFLTDWARRDGGKS